MKLRQGEKLMILIKRDERAAEEIARDLGYERTYFSKLYKLDKLPKRVARNAIAVYGLSEDFFDNDEAEAPQRVTSINQQLAEVEREIEETKKQIAQLAAQLAEKDRLNAQLIETLNNLTRPK